MPRVSPIWPLALALALALAAAAAAALRIKRQSPGGQLSNQPDEKTFGHQLASVTPIISGNDSHFLLICMLGFGSLRDDVVHIVCYDCHNS